MILLSLLFIGTYANSDGEFENKMSQICIYAFMYVLPQHNITQSGRRFYNEKIFHLVFLTLELSGVSSQPL